MWQPVGQQRSVDVPSKNEDFALYGVVDVLENRVGFKAPIPKDRPFRGGPGMSQRGLQKRPIKETYKQETDKQKTAPCSPMLNPAPILNLAGGANTSCGPGASRDPKQTGAKPILPQSSGLANRESLPNPICS